MKTIICLLVSVTCLLFAGCATTANPGAVSSTEQLWANGVDDVISLGLVPVLQHNSDYIAGAQAFANALQLFNGVALTPDDVNNLLAAAAQKDPALTPDAQKEIAALINAAWSRFTKEYQTLATTNVRPDVKLFIGAVADGIGNAVAAVQAANKPATSAPPAAS